MSTIQRIPPPRSLIQDPDLVVVSNKRPLQSYSDRIIKMFRLQMKQEVKLTAMGAAIPTALRISRFCAKTVKDDTGWELSSEVIDEGSITVQESECKPSFGQPPPDCQSREIKTITICLKRLS